MAKNFIKRENEKHWAIFPLVIQINEDKWSFSLPCVLIFRHVSYVIHLYSNVHPTCLEQWASPQSQLKRSIYLLSCVTLHSPQQTWPQYCEFAHKLIHKLPKRYLPILTHKESQNSLALLKTIAKGVKRLNKSNFFFS